ncbi:hypothetical protein INR49_003486, partial [Caranx melampygus]
SAKPPFVRCHGVSLCSTNGNKRTFGVLEFLSTGPAPCATAARARARPYISRSSVRVESATPCSVVTERAPHGDFIYKWAIVPISASSYFRPSAP